MKKILRYLKDYRKESILAPLFKMLEASFELLIPLVVAAIIDQGIPNRDNSYIIQMCIIMIVLGIIGLTCSLTAQYFSARAAVGFATKLRHALFSHIQSLSFTEMDTIGTSTLITRMTSDVNQVQSCVNMVLRLFLRSPFIVLGAMVMAFTIDWKAAMVFVVTIPLLCIVVFGVMLVTMPLYKKVQAGLDKVLGITRENLTGARVIRAFNKEESEIRYFTNHNQLLTTMQVHVGKIAALTNPFTYIIINGAIVALIYIGAVRVESGILLQGQVVALVNYMSQILVELIKMADLIVNITKSVACGDRIQSVFETKSSIVSMSETKEQERTDYAVELEHVCLTYQKAGAESLTDINLKVKKGQTIGVIGGTGSGKTSLVHLIPRFYDATKGTVKINGVDVRDYSIEELRNKIGIVMQKAVLFKGTIRENLLWGNREAEEADLWEALETAQAKEIVEGKEGGLDSGIAQGGKNLSGGQRQRFTIARALVRKPEILILDDSASALDYATDARLRKALRERKEEMTVFVVSQRTSSIQYADQIIVLDDGAAVGIGTHEELLQTCPVYQEIYYSQFPKEAK
ncbi:MAG: ABC transporter ATP-binding protein [Lachnospiraceae bacterium]|nr:ABC transporter ATP-binding protein [Lachnospiraceae bacterium]